MGDVVQQSGHEGGEAGHDGARVSAAAAEGSDVGGLPTCCVCMEPSTDSGAHRICCIPCGHVYGRSCLETWLSRGRSTSAKAPVTSESSGFDSDLFKQVLDVLNEPANIKKEHGMHVSEIFKRFKLPESKIRQAIEYHVDCGHVYTTVDDFHFMSAFVEWLPSAQETYYQQRVLTFQAPETGLLKQVLDILQEPANIEKEHGVHVAEMAKRLRLPESNIWDAMEQLIDMGFIYNTIDDFHFKSASME